MKDLQSVPFSEIFNDPENMKKLENQYKDVRDIRKTPIVKSLTAINELMFDYQELALKDIDTSQKAKEYAINITNELAKLDKSIQFSLLKVGVHEANIPIVVIMMMNPVENTVEYGKRWTELRNSLNSYLIEYKTGLAEKDEDEVQFNELAEDIRKFVFVDGKTLKHIIQFKELPPDMRVDKPVWRGTYASAAVFADLTGLKISRWNKCFKHFSGKPLKDSHYSVPQYNQNEIAEIKDKHIDIWEKYK